MLFPLNVQAEVGFFFGRLVRTILVFIYLFIYLFQFKRHIRRDQRLFYVCILWLFDIGSAFLS